VFNQNKNNPLPRIKFFERGVGKSFLFKESFFPHEKQKQKIPIKTLRKNYG